MFFFPEQVCDVLCCILFVIMYWRVAHEIILFEQRAEKENVTPADYSVEVRGIPEDANDEARDCGDTRLYACRSLASF